MASAAILQRAYGLLHVKAVDAEQRVITGIASTPEPDRMGDVIEPLGITFKTPVPLLLYHSTQKPVGTVTFDPPTALGLTFTASLPHVTAPGTVRDRVEEAWQSITSGLLGAVSIGFRSIEEAWNKETQSFHFLKSEVLELSLVAIPANADATISSIKALDHAARRPAPAPVASLPIPKGTPMTTGEQISAFENTRAAKSARLNAIMVDAAAQNATLDEAQSTEYDTLSTDVANVDKHLTRLRALDASNRVAAVPITVTTDPAAASLQRAGSPIIQVKANLPLGTGFIRYCQALLATRGNLSLAESYAQRWVDSTPEVAVVLKAAVAAGTTTDATWAGPLAPIRPLANEFMTLLRPATLLGKIPGLRVVPFNVSIPVQTGGGTYKWVGQGAPKPVGSLAFATVVITITKCAGIIVITDELARNSTPAAEEIIKQDMINGIAQFLDVQFTDPAQAPVANVSPGSITNGVTPITSAGTTPANARTDIQALINAMTAANISTAGAVLLMSETNAAVLSFALNALGQPLFPDMDMTGGTAMGIKVITSQSCGNNVILLAPVTVLYADDGGVTIDVSTEASLQMDNAPMNPADATVVMTSLWQNNYVGLRAERYINWKRGRPNGVQYTVQAYVAG
jgi:HK97 family phage major capsid protein/HK97 family phage prohead protease